MVQANTADAGINHLRPRDVVGEILEGKLPQALIFDAANVVFHSDALLVGNVTVLNATAGAGVGDKALDPPSLGIKKTVITPDMGWLDVGDGGHLIRVGRQ